MWIICDPSNQNRISGVLLCSNIEKYFVLQEYIVILDTDIFDIIQKHILAIDDDLFIYFLIAEMQQDDVRHHKLTVGNTCFYYSSKAFSGTFQE